MPRRPGRTLRARSRRHEPLPALALRDLWTVSADLGKLWLELEDMPDRPTTDRVLDAGARRRATARDSPAAPHADRGCRHERRVGRLVARCIAQATDRLRRHGRHPGVARHLRAAA